MNGKLTVTNESTGWTLVATGNPAPGEVYGQYLGRSYVSGRHGGLHEEIDRMSKQHGGLEVVWAGKSADYDREIAAIAADPYFMS